MKGEISVIVPIYNVAVYLEKCILSIMNQTYDKLQIILVDDGSTDDSGMICEKYAAYDRRIRVIHKENGGLVSARKAGIIAARGEYIGYVDGDDWIESDFYETMLCNMRQYQVDLVETEHYIEAGTQSKRRKSKLPYGKYNRQDLIPIMLCDEDFDECRLQPYLWSKLFKKCLIEKHQMKVDETIQCGEDIAVIYPYLLEAETIYIAEYAGYHYVQRQDSITGIENKGNWEQDRALICYLKTVFANNPDYSGIMLRQLNQYAKSMLLLRQIDIFDCNSEEKKLIPFGGLDEDQRIALYGAGRLGKSLYRYLKRLDRDIVMWGDKEFTLYKQLGLPVVSPEIIVKNQDQYDSLLIAVSSKSLAKMIQNFLAESGLKREKMIWLTEDFISVDYEVLSIIAKSEI